MIRSGLIEYFSYKWQYRNVAFKRVEYGTVVEENESGLMVQVTSRHSQLTGMPGDTVRLPYISKERYVLELSATEWATLKSIVQTERHTDEDQARRYLLDCISLALPRQEQRLNHAGISVAMALLAGIIPYFLLTMKGPPDYPAFAMIAAILLSLLVLVLGFTKGVSNRHYLEKMESALSCGVSEQIKSALCGLGQDTASLLNAWLCIALMAGSICFAFLSTQPKENLMLPSRRVNYYYEQGIMLHNESAEAALRRVPVKKAGELLQSHLDAPDADRDDLFYSGWLAARMHQQGRFPKELAQPVAQQALTNLSGAYLNNLGQSTRTELTEILGVCSPEFRTDYITGLSTSQELNPELLKSLGSAMQDLPAPVLFEHSDLLQAAGHDGLSYLQGAIAVPASVDDALRMLREQNADLRLRMAGALVKNFTEPDDLLEFLQAMRELGIPLLENTEADLAFDLKLNRFLSAAQPSNRLPEGEYTILPLRRVEQKESSYGIFTDRKMNGHPLLTEPIPSRGEEVAYCQTVTLIPDFAAALPPERLPGSMEETDLILLFDRQYLLHDTFSVECVNVISQRGYRVFPRYSLLQRVSVYDARTGDCLLVLDETSRRPRTPPKKLTSKRYYESILKHDTYDALEEYCYGEPNAYWDIRMKRKVLTGLQEHQGNLSVFLPAAE